MTCREFEPLMADALGGELSGQDKQVFDAHLTECESCRAEFEAGVAVLDRLRSLPAPDETIVSLRNAPPGTTRLRDGKLFMTPRIVPLMRYAASILIAFAAGYGANGLLSRSGMAGVSKEARRTSLVVDTPRPIPESLQRKLAEVHARGPKRSDLAKCAIALLSASQ